MAQNKRRNGSPKGVAKQPTHRLIVKDVGAHCTGCQKQVKLRSSCPTCGPFQGFHYQGKGKPPRIKGLVFLGALGAAH